MDLSNQVIINKGLFNNISVMENTLESFKLAFSKDYIVRFSLNILKDNNVIIFDSSALERLLNLKDNINTYNYEDLDYLASFKILKLLDIKEICINKIMIIFIPEYPKKLLQSIVKELKQLQAKIIIESDSIKVLKYFKKLNYSVSLLINYENKSKINSLFKPDIYNLEIDLFDKKYIKILRENYYTLGSIVYNSEKLLENKDVYDNLVVENNLN